MESNEIIDSLPDHLRDFIIDQPYNSYTAQDHELWRYVMRQNVHYLKDVAHESYLDGLKRTGVSIDEVPHMYGMNRILKDIGWAAVAVDGFIPPAAFMEFQAYNVLVIAADIRPIDQIEYTPAPDIIHEAAGHAPIIANEEYSEYLRRFGELGSKAFSSELDHKIYEAIRHLSILKAYPYTKPEEIELAEIKLSSLEKIMQDPSEMCLIRNLHWWTVEYGLIGDLNKPKIYGAGLLSSIGESLSCLKENVKKLPYNIETKDIGFDITNKQPQLFVTPDFKTLNRVLDEFSETMSLKRGGLYGINQAINSGNTATLVYSSGLQVSGTVISVIDVEGEPVYIKTTGGTQLSYNDKQLDGHGIEYHKDGFSSPAGKLKNAAMPLENMTDGDLDYFGIITGERIKLEFESGITVSGILKSVTRKNGKLLILSFNECTVNYNGDHLFMPEWGIYDMAVGREIVSAYQGPADPKSFELSYKAPDEKTIKIVHEEKVTRLHKLYQNLRDMREGIKSEDKLIQLWNSVKSDYPEDWLLPMSILEQLELNNMGNGVKEEIRNYLIGKRDSSPSLINLVNNGFSMIEADKH